MEYKNTKFNYFNWNMWNICCIHH